MFVKLHKARLRYEQVKKMFNCFFKGILLFIGLSSCSILIRFRKMFLPDKNLFNSDPGHR